MFQETTPKILSVAKVCLLLWQFAYKERFRERNVHFQRSFEDFPEALQINIERLFLYLFIKTSGVFFQYRKNTVHSLGLAITEN